MTSVFMKACLELADQNDGAAIFLHEVSREIISGKAQKVKFGDEKRMAVRRTFARHAENFGWSVDKIKRAVRRLRDLGVIETYNGDFGGGESRISLAPEIHSRLASLYKEERAP